MEEDIDIKELFLDILAILKFELKFYLYRQSPMFERIVKTRVFQQKLQKLKDFINKYFEYSIPIHQNLKIFNRINYSQFSALIPA